MTEQLKKGSAQLKDFMNQMIDSTKLSQQKIEENISEFKALSEQRQVSKKLMDDMLCLLKKMQTA